MAVKQVVDVLEETPPDEPQIPEVEIRGEFAVIRIETPENVEERQVKLPKTTWA